MKTTLLILFFGLRFLSTVGQEVQKEYFDRLIQVDQVNEKETKISLKEKAYGPKIKIVEELTRRYGKSKFKKGLIVFPLKKHEILKKILIDTVNTTSINLQFQKNASVEQRQKSIHEFQIMMKRKLMYWRDFKIKDKEVYFVGHRGGLMEHFEENTNDILFYSKKFGISYMEVDVLISKDSIPFVGHDWDYLGKKLKITRHTDSIYISKTHYKDGQKVTFLSTLLKQHQFLILDFIHNTVNDQKRIINYLYKNFPQEIQTNVYIQVDRKMIYDYIAKLNPKIKISYNYRGKNTGNWQKNWIKQMKPYFDNVEMFVVNPSNKINENMVKKFEKHAHKIIPVINKNGDTVGEIQRMIDLGFQFIMIDDIISETNKLNNQKIIKLKTEDLLIE